MQARLKLLGKQVNLFLLWASHFHIVMASYKLIFWTCILWMWLKQALIRAFLMHKITWSDPFVALIEESDFSFSSRDLGGPLLSHLTIFVLLTTHNLETFSSKGAMNPIFGCLSFFVCSYAVRAKVHSRKIGFHLFEVFVFFCGSCLATMHRVQCLTKGSTHLTFSLKNRDNAKMESRQCTALCTATENVQFFVK